jgi:hypothetical protein
MNTYYKASNRFGIGFGPPHLFPNLSYGCHYDHDMLDASFTVLQNTNQKNGFLDLKAHGLMEFTTPLDSWLPQ